MPIHLAVPRAGLLVSIVGLTALGCSQSSGGAAAAASDAAVDAQSSDASEADASSLTDATTNPPSDGAGPPADASPPPPDAAIDAAPTPVVCGTTTCAIGQHCERCGASIVCADANQAACCSGSPSSANGVDLYDTTTRTCCTKPGTDGYTLTCAKTTETCLGPANATTESCVPSGSSQCGPSGICDPADGCLTCGANANRCAPRGQRACCVGSAWSSSGVDSYDPATRTCCPRPDRYGRTLLCNAATEVCVGPSGANFDECRPSGSVACGQSAICNPTDACLTCPTTGNNTVRATCAPRGNQACCVGNARSTTGVDDYDPFTRTCCPRPDRYGYAITCNRATDICLGPNSGSYDECRPSGSVACGQDLICAPDEACFACPTPGPGRTCAPRNHAACCNGTPWSSYGVDTIDPSRETCCPGPDAYGRTKWCTAPLQCVYSSMTLPNGTVLAGYGCQ